MAALALKRRTPSLGTLPTMPSISVIDNPLPSVSVTNKQAQGSSLYHTCRAVLDKLAAIDGMATYLNGDPLPPIGASSTSPTSSEPSTPTSHDGPLNKLWAICRRGTPLCHLFNALKPEKPLNVDSNPNLNQINVCKASVYHFIVACKEQLQFSEDDLFTITDLYQNDTNGFVKVVNTIDKILQLLEKEGVISVRSSNRNSDPNAPKDTRDKVVLELIETERKYVQDLEVLQNYMRELQNQKILSPDTIHYLFGNLNVLVDFQRRFLIQLEDAAEKPPEEQRFCHLFRQNEEAFAVYEPYCANYYSAQDLVIQETPKLQKLADILNPTYELPSMLIKPVQRICKYPLLLEQLIKTTNTDWPFYAEMESGLEAIKRVTEKVNETQRKHENLQAVEELKKRIDDAKNYDIESFGSLLLQGKVIMTTNDNEREMQIFLFEKMMFICKETKDASKNRLTKSNTLSIKKKRRGSLQAKGKIYTDRIVGVHNRALPGQWILTVEFKHREVERFTLKFRNEEQLKLWETTLNKLKVTKTHVPNTHLLSMNMTAQASQHSTLSDNASYIDDDEDDEEDLADLDEDAFHAARSRSNSVAAQHILNGRPKMTRNDSQETLWTMGSDRTLTPGMNLSPLPRNPDHGIYPVSPPLSGPSSPGVPPRTSGGSATPLTWHRRPHNGPEDNSPLADIASKFMSGEATPSAEEYRAYGYPPPVGRSQSHSAAGQPQAGMPGHPFTAGMPPSALAQTRMRSQSSPNIHKNDSGQWHDLPQVPINSRTLYQKVEQANGMRTVSSSPRLSEMTTPMERSMMPNSPGTIKIKLSFNDGIYVIVVPQDVSFAELMEKVEKKIRLVANLKPTDQLRLKYQDEDEDLITINSDDDIQMAFESRGNNTAVNLFVHL